MNSHEIMQLIKYAVRDLQEAVTAYNAAIEGNNNKWGYGLGLPNHQSREAIKRRIVQIRQDLLMLEKEL